MKLKGTLKNKKIGIQGFGNVGYHAAKFLQEDDEAKIVSIIEFNGGLINPKGIDVEKAKTFFSEHGTFKNCPEGKFQEKTDDMLTAEYDILIPAAKENVIDQKNANKIKSKLIVEAANGPISFEADEILNKQGVIIIRYYCQCWWCRSDYFEWVRNLRHIRFGRLEKEKFY